MTGDQYLNQRVAKDSAGIFFFGTVIAIYQDKTDKQRKVYEVRFYNIKETEEAYTTAVCDLRAN